MRKDSPSIISFVFFIFFCLYPLDVFADKILSLSEGQRIYVPAYSHIYIGNEKAPRLLTITLSVRNSDQEYPIKLKKVNYYETNGNIARMFIQKDVTLKPLESIQYVVPHKDEVGGSGANFIVEWSSTYPVNPPIVETIMIGQQGISFTSRGQALVDR